MMSLSDMTSETELHWDEQHQYLQVRAQLLREMGVQAFRFHAAPAGHCVRVTDEGTQRVEPCELPFIPELFWHPQAEPWRNSFAEPWQKLFQVPGTHSLLLLQLACHSHDARCLLHTTPLLLWLWCQRAVGLDTRFCDLQHALHRPRQELARELGLPTVKGVFRILGKFPLEPWTRTDSNKLIQALHDPAFRAELSHHRALSRQRFLLLWDYPLLRHMPMRNALPPMDEAQFWQTENTLRDMQMMARQLEQESATALARNCRTLDDLQRCHDRIAERFNDLELEHRLARDAKLKEPFPQPPLPGNAHITPITHIADLYHEGKTMRHCVGGYAFDIICGKYFAYRLHMPDTRATIGLKRAGSTWILAEVKAACNRKVSRDIEASVTAWIAEKRG